MKPKHPPSKSTPIDGRLPTVGWGPFRYQWYSICSGHGMNADGNYYDFDVDCSRCTSGSWINCYLHEVESFIYENDPRLWRWWVNRPLLILSAKNLLRALKKKNAR